MQWCGLKYYNVFSTWQSASVTTDAVVWIEIDDVLGADAELLASPLIQ